MDIKCSVYIATSVDGFIADADGGIQWLHNPEYSLTGQQGLTYEDFISTVDALVMGSRTFETVLSFSDWPYEGTPVVVLSSREWELPPTLETKVKFASGEPRDIAERLANEGHRHLYIDGGITIQRFLRAGLIDEIIITRIPILLGGGISLFGSLGVRLPLRLLESAKFDSGLVQVRYAVEWERRTFGGQMEIL